MTRVDRPSQRNQYRLRSTLEMITICQLDLKNFTCTFTTNLVDGVFHLCRVLGFLASFHHILVVNNLQYQ